MKACVLLSVLCGAVASRAQSSLTVQVKNGTLQGAKCPTTSANSFLGIPFAQAPLGSLRFAPPEPYNQTYTVLNATTPPPACIQFNQEFAESGAQSEDCLFVNVWAPANATTDSKLPVKVWLFGGGNLAGGISDPTYDGCTASESVIQVSINYRLGPLGFLYLQSLNLAGNQGIQDQLLGLQWVQDNIGAFGGDSSKVLLFGQSAGGFDTCVLSSLPQAPSLFSAAIMESGVATNLSTPAELEPAVEAFVRALNCSTTDIACLRGAPVSALNASFLAHPTSGGEIGLVVDGTVVPAQPLKAGLKVPAVAGSNTNEGTLFVLGEYGAGVTQLNATTYDAYLSSEFGSSAQKVNETYPLSKYQGSVFDAMSAIITDSEFRCPTRRFLQQAAQDGVPVWTYSFNHTLSCPWYPTIPADALQILKSTHTAEIPFVFGGTSDMPRPNGDCNLSASAMALSTKMLAAWNNMAAEANPGSDWPRYGSSNSSGINVVGDDFSAGTVDYSMCDFWDDLISASTGANGTGSGNSSSTGKTTSGAAGLKSRASALMLYTALLFFFVR